MKAAAITIVSSIFLTILAGFMAQFVTVKDLKAVEGRVVDSEKASIRIEERLKYIEEKLDLIISRL